MRVWKRPLHLQLCKIEQAACVICKNTLQYELILFIMGKLYALDEI